MSLKSSSQAWEGLTVDYGPLHALVDKIGQQMYVAIKHECWFRILFLAYIDPPGRRFAIGLDVSLL
jgi:hypothetical protein